MPENNPEVFMNLALELAERGAGLVAPNPKVGAVLVSGNQIIGQGYHKSYGQNHAEVEALLDCKNRNLDPRGSTMYVTLEPCCHYGKTPPCTDAILQAGISRIEIAALDPFEKVSGNGANLLRNKGIEVNIGLCQNQALRLNTGYFKRIHQQLPQVICKWAQSIDGKLSWQKELGKRWITGPAARKHVHRLRQTCGAIIAGIGTVLADDPLLNVRLQHTVKQPLRVILDTRLQTPMHSKIIQSATEFSTLICTCEESLKSRAKPYIEKGCEIMACPERNGVLDLETVLKNLAKRGIDDVLAEGGPTVHNYLLENKLADKIAVYIAPVLIGDTAQTAPLHLSQPVDRLHDMKIEQIGDDLLIEGYLQPVPAE